MDKSRSAPEEEVQVRELIELWIAAVRRRDFAGIIQDHSADIVMFDVPPPFQSRGIEAYKKTWDLFFACSGDPVAFGITEMNITAGSDVAFVFATMRCDEPESDGGRKPLNFRLTIGLRKIGGQWLVTHEHHSIPAVE
jgi:ketosteroid isomerase-like protein